MKEDNANWAVPGELWSADQFAANEREEQKQRKLAEKKKDYDSKGPSVGKLNLQPVL